MGCNDNAEPDSGMILGLDTLRRKLQLERVMRLFSMGGLPGSNFKDLINEI
jgi:hypothetical protein